MGKRKENEPRVYIIPKNFWIPAMCSAAGSTAEIFIEAAALTAPVFSIFLYGWKGCRLGMSAAR